MEDLGVADEFRLLSLVLTGTILDLSYTVMSPIVREAAKGRPGATEEDIEQIARRLACQNMLGRIERLRRETDQETPLLSHVESAVQAWSSARPDTPCDGRLAEVVELFPRRGGG